MVELNVKAFTQYRRKQIAELRPWREGDDMAGISVSREDVRAGSPRPGDMIARNPKNHSDQWLVAAAYFADNFEPASALPTPNDGLVGIDIEQLARTIVLTCQYSWPKDRVEAFERAERLLSPALQSQAETIARLETGLSELQTEYNAFEQECRRRDEAFARKMGGLEMERDEALDRHSSAVMGEIEATQRAEAAEQQVQKLTAENERLREATKESSRLLKDLDLGRSIHNSRFPQQNIDGPLWAQIPRICEIARVALDSKEDKK